MVGCWHRCVSHAEVGCARAEVELCLLQFDGKRYDVDAFVLMPNHVHALIKPALGYDLSTILQGIKGVSANRCNKLLGFETAFWMDESYDHVVRDAQELAAFRNYIACNPAKAGRIYARAQRRASAVKKTRAGCVDPRRQDCLRHVKCPKARSPSIRRPLFRRRTREA